jgi:hypothetical protein
VAAAIIVGLPALRGELGTYMDVPIHLEEIADLARPDSRGWTELGLCGFPLHIVQSPLLYGGLAAIARWGWPVSSVFALLTVAALASPALAFYAVARRRAGAAAALAAAATLLFYRGGIVGVASNLGGMFGFHFAAALLILLIDRLAEPSRDLRALALIAALTGLVGLMHIWVTLTLVLVAIVHGVSSLTSREGRERLRFDVPALALGCAAAAAYWLPNVLARVTSDPDRMPLLAPIKRFFTFGTSSRPGSFAARLAEDPVHGLDVLVQFAVLVALIVGFGRLRRSQDRAARYGAWLAGLLFALLMIDGVTHVPVLGPQGFRQIYFLKVGVLAACMPLLAGASGAFAPRRRATLGLVVAGTLAFAFAMKRVPESVKIEPGSVAAVEMERLWAWLHDHRDARWGRVVVEDTMGDERAPAREGPPQSGDDAMIESHVLAETASHAGVEQVGPYFSGLPSPTERWTRSENGLILGASPAAPAFVDDVVARMKRANATHLVLADRVTARRIAADDRFALEREEGRYRVFSRRGAESRWATAADGPIRLERIAPGRMRLDLEESTGPVSVSESFHRFWRAEPPSAATVRAAPDGLMVVEPSAGTRSFELVYDPPRFPLFVSLGAWSVIAALVATSELRRRRR